MYADRLAVGSKRSAIERINSSVIEDYGRSRPNTGKRQRQSDDKWKHDLYEDGNSQVSNLKVGPKDLRLKLQRKGLQQTHQNGKVSVKAVRDLRERLSGTMHSLPANSEPPKVRVVTEVAKPVKKSNSVNVRDVPVPGVKEAGKSHLSKSGQPKAEKNTVDVLLRSLSLEKYLITFQAEEIDMTALMHMTDGDLKALGIPMGPRKKILLALDART